MGATSTDGWPAIPVEAWQDTRDTLQLYTQVVGKVRMANEPLTASAPATTPTLRSGGDDGRVGGIAPRSTVREDQPMTDPCTHLDTVTDVTPSSNGCEDCERIGGRWVHLRVCMSCGHVGCCDNSPNRHATGHWHQHPDHPLIRSYEPGEDWWWCYPDELFFEVDGAPPAPSHP